MENLRRLLVTVIGMKNNCILYIRPDFSRKSSPILQLYPAYQAVVFHSRTRSDDKDSDFNPFFQCGYSHGVSWSSLEKRARPP